MNPRIAARIVDKSSKVQGWFSKEAGQLIAMIDEFQKQNNVTGDVFEIGVHHGKSSIFFSHLLTASENLHICDLFGNFGNVSNSGSGDERIFAANMRKFGLKTAAVSHKCLSTTLTPEKIGKDYRMFHVDGGHNPDEAYSDILLASQTLHEEGVIIVDDPFRVEWPGVTEAIVKFLELHKDFEPIAVGFNKFLIGRKKSASRYRHFISNTENRKNYGLVFPWEFKELPFAGGKLHIFFVPTRYLHLNAAKVWLAKLRQKIAR